MTQNIFTQLGIEPDYKDVENLEKFLTARRKLRSAEDNKLPAKIQRKLATAVKYARYLALIPYISYQTEKVRQSRP